ncbi:RNA methyltransferase [Polynucleobacter sp. Latsch14-2]|jgi:TrmH family RNA methyltransferase|uniref:TrmH family RNA methyltransferase n=1 Tax=Polynucleobacter sp. Latsch14-2 TaxID=2576920 RepID=UPI001C0C751E|nr:RNA methyltransferase [Polynucleobacter sp. Latsch14-2]MBU3614801.1 RNA methyltransferase [Polynucleobacter sp. Latsch14-2]
MKTEIISSTENSLFKELRLLQATGSKGQKARASSGQALLEGIHLIQTWIGDPNLKVLLTSGTGLKNPEIAEAVYSHLETCPDTRLYQLDVALWDELSELVNAPHIAGLLKLPQSSINPPQAISTLAGDVLILDRIQDAGNVGSILRTAAAAGFAQVIAVSGCAHLWSNKVLRAGMGAHRLLDLYEGWSTQQVLSAVTAPLMAATADGESDLYTLTKELIHPVAWLMGSEGQGVSEEFLAQAKGVAIPIDPRVESLNVSTAAAICLFETVRVRR